jgi:transitional endoplasmic reticulum ATPase
VLPCLKEGQPLEDSRGILLLGPPGTGKTQVAAALASALGKKLFKLRPQHSPYVGSSERHFRAALATIERAAPTPALLDEIDREFLGADSNADSGVTARMFSELLQWIERTDKVFAIATSNAVKLLDSAALRPGRFHPHFFVGPNPATRWALLQKGKREFGLALEDSDITPLADAAWGFSGARIWHLVKRARRRPEEALAFIRDGVEAERGAAEQEYRRYLHLKDIARPASSLMDE